jgi:hypothetical protein
MLDSSLLQSELVHLQRDANTGKLDHPIGKSKDLSDSFAGAVWNAVIQNPDVMISTKKIVNAMRSVNAKNYRGGSELSSIFVDSRYKHR